MVRMAAGTLAGNLFVHALPALPSAWMLGVAVLLAAILLARGWIVPGVALLAFAWTAITAQAALDRRLPADLIRHDVVVTGYIASFPRHEPGRSAFEFRVLQGPEEVPPLLRLSWYDPPVLPVAGQTLHVEVRLRPPRSSMNPGGRDYEQWMLVRGIGASGYVRHVLATEVDGVRSPWLLRFRARLVAAVEEHLGTPRRATAVILATTLGAWNGMDAADGDVFTRTGTIHLVAISGLHVSLVAALGLAGFRRVWAWLPGPARRVAPLSAGAVAGLLLAVVYAALAGFGIPVRRALWMLSVVLAAIVLRRSPTPWQGLSLAAIVVLAVDPLATLDVSFWLSFTAIAVIFLILLARRQRAAEEGATPAWRRSLLLFVTVQVLIEVGIAPAVGLFFLQVPLTSVLANTALIPVFSFFVIPAALLGTALLQALPTVGGWLLSATAQLLDWIWIPLAWLAQHPWAVWPLPGLPPLWWGAVVLAVLLVLAPRGLPGRWLALPLLAAALTWQPPAPAPGGFQLMMLDVGQGLSLWVRTANHVLLYDAGPAADEGFDAGRSTVVPALRHFGIRRVDVFVISHEHNDHAGGASAVLAALPVDRVLAGGGIATQLGGEPCRDGQSWEWDGVSFEMLHPVLPDERGNNGSCVLSIRGDGVSVLLTGDIEARAEQRLLAEGRLLPHDIVQVPHHGSLTSSQPAFVAATAPGWALVGTGFANQWNFPRAEVVARWEGVGATVLNAGEIGAIELWAHPGGEIEVLPAWRERSGRYWRAAATSVAP